MKVSSSLLDDDKIFSGLLHYATAGIDMYLQCVGAWAKMERLLAEIPTGQDLIIKDLHFLFHSRGDGFESDILFSLQQKLLG